MELNTIENVTDYITKNWRYIKEEELLDLIDMSFNFGYSECEYEKNNKDVTPNQSSNDSYEEGHENGYEQGHRDGYSEGHEEGYNEGRNE